MSTPAPTRKGPRAQRRGPRSSLLLALCGLLALAAAPAGASVEVFAEFASAAGAEGVREARLWVDGVEVTDRSAVSKVRISYALPGDFPTGAHEARVQVVDALGRTHEKSWSFEHEEGSDELVAFFTDELFVELDRVPRRVVGESVRLGGTSLPEVEIEVRLAGAVALRTTSSATGRFSLSLPLEPGANEIGVAATRPWTGEEGREVRLRLDRILLTKVVEESPRSAPRAPAGARRDGRDAPDAPSDRSLPGGSGGEDDPSDDDPPDDDPPDDDPVLEVRITHPSDGAVVRNSRVPVLGLAPPGWSVDVLVDGELGGSDVANPAGHFTVPRVELGSGTVELVAEATDPESGLSLRSSAVFVEVDPPRGGITWAASGSRAVARDGRYLVQGRAWPGAMLEVELNGRWIGTETADLSGRFSFPVAVERGLNSLVIEAVDLDSGRAERSTPLRVRGLAPARRVRSPFEGRPPLERTELPGGTSALGRVKPRP